MTPQLRHQHRWVFYVITVVVWLASGWPTLRALTSGAMIRGAPVSALWLVPFTLFGAAVLAAMILKLRPRLQWMLLCVELAAVVAMTIIVPWAGMSQFLLIIAWQVAMSAAPGKALSWVAFQSLLAAIGRGPSASTDTYVAEVLTVREREVLHLICAGYSNREIADLLALAEGTVRKHVSSLLLKLHARDRTGAALKAL